MISPQERAQAASGACPHRVIDEIYFGLRLRRLSRFHFSAHDAVFCAIHDVHLGFAICVDCGGGWWDMKRISVLLIFFFLYFYFALLLHTML